MDELSPAAKAIGAVNCVTVLPDGRLHGDNTDWIGVRGQLAPALGSTASSDGWTGLICGAGGSGRAACYALGAMGFKKVYLHNRTISRAAALVDEFSAQWGESSFEVMEDLAALEGLPKLHTIISTLPGSVELEIPGKILQTHRPVLMAAAYKSSPEGSRLTPLLEQGQATGCTIIEGMEMLFEQGCAQCENWTAQPAPRRAIAAALLKERFEGAGDPPPPANLLKEAQS